MPSVTLVDTTSAQTLTGPKTLVSPVLTGANVTLAAAPTQALEAATKGYVDGLNTYPILNGSLAASVSGNALTLSLKTAGGSTPSASDPVRVTFRRGTDADGSLVTRTISSAITLTFTSGSTLGMSNGQAARIWVGLIDNNGTVELCAWNPVSFSTTAAANATSVHAFTPNTYVTTTAEGSGTATSAQVLYSTNARSTVPFVLLGFIEVTEATAGIWASAPTVVQTYRDGMRKTGEIVKTKWEQNAFLATGATPIPIDNTVPQNTEGDQYMSLTFTPTSAINVLRIRVQGQWATSSASNWIVMALFRDSIANALAVMFGLENAAQPTTLAISHNMIAGTTNAITFKVRAGTTAGMTLTFNGVSSGALMGGVCNSFMEVEEIYA